MALKQLLGLAALFILLSALLPAMAEGGGPEGAGQAAGYTFAFGPTFDEHGIDVISNTIQDHDTVNLQSDQIQWAVFLYGGFRPIASLGNVKLGYFLEYEFKTLHLKQTGEINDFGGTSPPIHPQNEVKGWYALVNPVLALQSGRSTIGIGPGIGYLNLKGDFMVPWWDQPATTEPLRISQFAKVFTFKWEFTFTHFLMGMKVNFFEALGDQFNYSFTAAHVYTGFRFAL